MNSLSEQLLKQGLRSVAFIAKELAPEPFDQTRHWFAVIDIAGGEHKREQFALIVDDQMQFEAEIVADTALATRGLPIKYFMMQDAFVMTNRERGRIDEGHASRLPQLRQQIERHRPDRTGHQFDKSRIAHQAGKFAA